MHLGTHVVALIISTFLIFIILSCDREAKGESVAGCLLNPYISSFGALDAIFVGKNRTPDGQEYSEVSVNLTFRMDYTNEVRISNLRLREFVYLRPNTDTNKNVLFSTRDTETRIEPLSDSNDNNIIYTDSLLAPIGGKSVSYVWTKAKAFNSARELYKRLSLSQILRSALEVAGPCSMAYVERADLVLQDQQLVGNTTQLLETYSRIIFYKAVRCQETLRWNAARGEFVADGPRDIYIGYMGSHGPGLVSAVRSGSINMYALANGEIVMSNVFVKPPSLSMFDNLLTFPAPLTYRPFADAGQLDSQSPILKNRPCLDAVKNLPTQGQAGYEDFQIERPLVTLTRSVDGPGQFITVESYNANLFAYNLDESSPSYNGSSRRSNWRKGGLFKERETSKLLAITIYSLGGVHRCHAIFKPHISIADIVYLNANIDSNYEILSNSKFAPRQTVNPAPVPDDIAYWSSCKKIVSFYGFMYVLHHHEDDILRTVGTWNLLPEEHFDYPVEAVHAEGNDFYFFFKASTLYHVVVGALNCDKLEILKVNKNHHQSQFFKLDSIVYHHTGGRYYDSNLGAWTPDWSQDAYEPLNSPADSRAILPYWIYIIAGLLGALLLLLLLVFFLARQFSSELHPSMMRSIRSTSRGGSSGAPSGKSAHSYQFTLHPIPPQPPQPIYQTQAPSQHNEAASVMPLFVDTATVDSNDKRTTTTKPHKKKKHTKKPKTPLVKTPRSPLNSKDPPRQQKQNKQTKHKKSLPD